MSAPARRAGLPFFSSPRPPESFSRRLRARYNKASHVVSTANECVFAINHLSFSSPSARTFSSLSTQDAMLDHIWRASSSFVSRLSRDAYASEVSGDDSFSFTDNTNPYILHKPPVPLVADLVSLPAEPATAQLLDLLPTHLSRLYASPSPDLLRCGPARRPGRALAAPGEWERLVQRGTRAGLFEFTQEPRVVNGVFGVAKPDGSIRFIIAAQPANDLFVPPPRFELPSPELLGGLVLPHTEKRPLLTASCDISDYYHRIGTPRWMWPYFALPPVTAAVVLEVMPALAGRFSPTDLVWPMCKTLPMGFAHSPYIGQHIHEHLVHAVLGMPREDRLARECDLRLDRPRFLMYIDDWKLFGFDAAHMSAVQDRYVAAAAACGLPVKPSKLIRAESVGEALGMQVDGVRRQVSLAPDKMYRLVRATHALVESDRPVTAIQMQSVVGHWVWAMLLCRPALSVFSSVYRFIEAVGDGSRLLWGTVRAELRLAAGLAPLLWRPLEALVADVVVATDASSFGQGVAAIQVAESVARAVVSDRVVPARVPDDVSVVAPVPVVPRRLRELLPPRRRWMSVVSSPWRHRGAHINELELRALLTGVRWAVSRPRLRGRRLVCIADSMVAIGCVRKGRSSSYPLLRVLRSLAGWLLGSGGSLSLYYVETDSNPADDLSRGRL